MEASRPERATHLLVLLVEAPLDDGGALAEPLAEGEPALLVGAARLLLARVGGDGALGGQEEGQQVVGLGVVVLLLALRLFLERRVLARALQRHLEERAVELDVLHLVLARMHEFDARLGHGARGRVALALKLAGAAEVDVDVVGPRWRQRRARVARQLLHGA